MLARHTSVDWGSYPPWSWVAVHLVIRCACPSVLPLLAVLGTRRPSRNVTGTTVRTQQRQCSVMQGQIEILRLVLAGPIRRRWLPADRDPPVHRHGTSRGGQQGVEITLHHFWPGHQQVSYRGHRGGQRIEIDGLSAAGPG